MNNARPIQSSDSSLSINGWSTDQYELIDFGGGRKLERFGSQLLDRPSPAAADAHCKLPDRWPSANCRLDDCGQVLEAREALASWSVRYEAIEFQLRLTPFGHVGLFPEHAATWAWLSHLSPEASSKQFLNLFAYTGGASLVMAAAGWNVVHVDSSAPTVAWARENAITSRLNDLPIRWLVDDARSFVAREVRRGRRYDAILLDPPTYGHGPKGKAWQFERDLPSLLEDCCRLLSPGGSLVLTGHTDKDGQSDFELASLLRSSGHSHVRIETGRTLLQDASHRDLDFGWYVRAKPLISPR